MADQTTLSLHAQIVVKLAPDWEPGPVDIIAHSARELIDTIRELKAHEAEVLGGAPQPAPEPQPQQQAPAPQPQQAAPTPTPGPTAAQTAPQPQQTAPQAPSAAAAAPAPAATPSAEQTAELKINDVLNPARQLLQVPGGEDRLRAVLAECGEEAISTADPKNYAAIKAGIERNLLAQ